MNFLNALRNFYAAIAVKLSLLEPLALFAARLAVARVFFNSGMNKWNGFLSFNPGSYDLFLYEFFCPETPRGRALTLCLDRTEGSYAPTTQWIVERFANMAGIMEILLPLLLVFGLTSRLAAFGLLAMTIFIELFIFPDADSWWGSHVWWAALLFIILARGPGTLSLDRFLGLEKNSA
jgi:putative oxidoreductase